MASVKYFLCNSSPIRHKSKILTILCRFDWYLLLKKMCVWPLPFHLLIQLSNYVCRATFWLLKSFIFLKWITEKFIQTYYKFSNRFRGLVKKLWWRKFIRKYFYLANWLWDRKYINKIKITHFFQNPFCLFYIVKDIIYVDEIRDYVLNKSRRTIKKKEI